ncbi:translation elongation factor Ts [Sulfuriferula sp.]|uniref:translation elongation factor Ts n=1 Tax=Sulfuriferula sp. TaxID=2025307 RepID=UPI002730F9B7|nr:translation elongation factor Ts [Sulfuriferula sp.]MDP2027740.1 translation elongation factor Ts [Sulfuriferula sp.]
MAEITAGMVKELRERTGLGMMECKKALIESAGDLGAAEDLMRIKSGAKASKAAGRVAAEGVIGSFISAEGKKGALVEINCETDFVAKNEDFLGFAQAVAQLAATHGTDDVAAVAAMSLPAGGTVEALRQALIMKLGENLSIRRIALFSTAGRLAAYLHGSKIGVMVDLDGEEALGKDIAMHIAASKPVCVSKDQVSADLLDKEREIYTAQAADSGKPADIVAKMVEGRVAKFLAEVTLLGQPFVKNPDVTVEKLLAEKKAKVNGFTMYLVGEGIEKKVVDYAAEVAAAAKV